MATTLCRFRFPTFDLCPVTELYVRPVHNAEHSILDGEVRLGTDGVVQFDTYFNAFGVGKWLRHTTVRQVAVAAQVTGACRLEVVHDRVDRRPVVVATSDVKADEPTWFELALPALESLVDGSAFLRVSCIGEGATLRHARWQTDEQPPRPCRLGVVITTFNRGDEVRANIARLAGTLREAPDYADRIEVVVVDNGRNLVLDVDDGLPISVLPNPNTGGAGGFTRGLLHFRERPGVTHVLFMDDDVSFDPEIVLRTIQLLSFARHGRLCVAGAMLRQSAPTEQFEAGARFQGKAVYPIRASGHNIDLRDWHAMMQSERREDDIDYGAWWFFAFPVDLTTDNPIPAFVRGDDVCWGLMHAGRHTVTFNGIGLWHADFEYKNGPLAWFYDTRNFGLACALSSPGFRWWHLLGRYLNTCGRSLLSFKYASAANITFGMQEFMRGPQHWLDIDHAKLNESVSSFGEERIVPLSEDLMAVEDVPAKGRLTKYAAALGSLAVLGGHILPDRLHRTGIGAVPIQQRAVHASTLRREILYRDERRDDGFVARRDQARFFALLAQMARTAVRIPVEFDGLKRDYRAAYPQMVSKEYWERQFTSL